MIAVSIYCYLIKYQPKQKHLLPFHDTNNKLNDIIKIVVSNKVSFGKKVLNISLAIKMLKLELYVYFSQKMSAYSRDFDETKYMSFLIKDDELSEKYNGIWEKVSKSIKKEFDSESVYNKKYQKTKLKS